MLKSVGESTSTFGTPVFVFLSVDLWLLYSVYCLRPLMSFAMYLSIVLGMLVVCSLCMRVCRFTVSNAFERSRAIATVLLGFFVVKTFGDCVVHFV